MTTTRVTAMIEATIGKEGGYSNNPKDRGGATMWGITEAVARANGYSGDMRNLPRTRAVEIYKNEYYTKPGFGRVEQRSHALAEELFDTGVNMGTKVPGEFLQRLLNVFNREAKLWPDIKVDGDIGDRTLAALDMFLKNRKVGGETVLLRALNCLQGARYVELAERRPANEEFVYGWILNRVVV